MGRNCKLDNIKVPLLSGNLNTLIDKGNTSQENIEEDTEDTEMVDDSVSQSENTSQITHSMARTSLVQRDQSKLIENIKIDFKKLPREVRSSRDLEKPKSALSDVTKKVNELKSTID